MVAAVDQYYLRIGVPQRMRGRKSGEAAADNDDARSLAGTVRSPPRRLKFGIRRCPGGFCNADL
jgi:hypothetical protein